MYDKYKLEDKRRVLAKRRNDLNTLKEFQYTSAQNQGRCYYLFVIH